MALTIPLILALLLPLQTKSKHDSLIKNFSSQCGMGGDTTAFESNTLSNAVKKENRDRTALSMKKMRSKKKNEEKSWRKAGRLCLHVRILFFFISAFNCCQKS
ncbi:hypothetical protein MA16_Dca023216 [Dendrobium catenatum]|uniref:Uncharacterized protein n=1 Tax=Dendrobium catenatum TaxID=906689 RepID=A0A2I0VW80_9ASPA|nr:hypothetical protein MA16_Dca023216 [Dendrobium catenatum]